LSEWLKIQAQVLRKRAPLDSSLLVDEFVRSSISQHGGGVILWVGISFHLGDWANNLQQIFLRSGCAGRGPQRYDDLFVLTVSDKGSVATQRLRYGDPAE
jgi:hypothetical protein